MKKYLFDTLPEGPFSKLRKLLSNIVPQLSLLDMSIGEPKHPFPKFVNKIINDNIASFNKYPAALGIDKLLSANANWLNNRFKLNHQINKNKNIVVLNGTREGLFSAGLMAIKTNESTKPIIAMPDPFYQAYLAGGIASQADILFLPTNKESGFLPILENINTNDWKRMAAFYVCSPSNPQGVFINKNYYSKLINLAIKYDFLIFSDECYSEIYSNEAPISALKIASIHNNFKNVISFFSLSKRSNLPGLRSGFCAGDERFISRFKIMRNIAAPQVPLALQYVAAEVWADELHVIENRKKYNQKFDLADQILGTMFNYERPKGGFFLWLNMDKYGGGIKAAKDLWKYCGIKALPGIYLSNSNQQNHYTIINKSVNNYLRLALVDSFNNTKKALNRIVKYYSN